MEPYDKEDNIRLLFSLRDCHERASPTWKFFDDRIKHALSVNHAMETTKKALDKEGGVNATM
jgi:hypothetical protein